MKFFKDSLRFKYILFIIAIIIFIFLGFILLFYYILNNFYNYQKNLVKNIFIEETKSEVKANLQIVQKFIDELYNTSAKHYEDMIKDHLRLQAHLLRKILNVFYLQYKDVRNEKELQKEMLELIKKINEEHKEVYFFVIDSKGILLEHPHEPKLIGKNIANLRDMEGKYFIKEILNLAKEKGQGYVSYFWYNYLKDVPEKKITYIFLFKPFSWIIGVGLHPEKFLQSFEASVQKKN